MILSRRFFKFALIALTSVVYLGVSYVTMNSDHPPLAEIFLGVAPLGAATLLTAWNSRVRGLLLLLWSACALTLLLNLENLRNHIAWLYFFEHAGAMTFLFFVFGSTLKNGHADALCSRIAGFVVRDPLDADYLRYTWNVTFAWAIFFFLSALMSAYLFFFWPIEVWSVFANLLTPILLGIMFAGEYFIRLRLLPGHTHFSVVETIHAYLEYSRSQNSR